MVLTTRDWAEATIEQLHWHWQAQLRPRFEGLTDEEYFWEPVPGRINLHLRDGAVVRDRVPRGADPPPVTTIALRLTHMAWDNFALRDNYHFGDRSLQPDDARWPATADDALDLLDRSYASWHAHIADLDDEALARHSVGPPGTIDAEFPFALVVFHVNREILHHGAEVAVLRDLYRAGAGAISPPADR